MYIGRQSQNSEIDFISLYNRALVRVSPYGGHDFSIFSYQNIIKPVYMGLN